MPVFDDDDDRDLAGSQDGSSDNDADETMQDVDDGDADMDADLDGDGEGDGEADDDDEGESQSGETQPSDNEDTSGEQEVNASQDVGQQSLIAQVDAVRASTRSIVRPEMLSASTYDIVPTIAAPMSTSVNAICATADTRWVFTGGSDGYIRKFNWVDSVNNKLALTVAQRHPFVDSVVKAGVLMTYWENWDSKPTQNGIGNTAQSQSLCPVYSLACHSQGLWLLSGTASGPIRLQSIRHDEGKQVALLQKHTSAVSVLSLSSDERSLLSGSWDKTVLDWDLDTGKVKTTYAAGTGQISAIESRPISNVPVPAETGQIVVTNGTFSSNNAERIPNGVHSKANTPSPPEKLSGATPDSLFGGDDGDDDLFGDSNAGVMTNGADLPDAFGDDDVDEMSRAMANGPQPEDGIVEDLEAGADLSTQAIEADPVSTPGEVGQPAQDPVNTTDIFDDQQSLANGLPHAEDLERKADADDKLDEDTPLPTSDSTFLATSVDGAIRVWDRRTPTPVAKILPRNTPLWCLSACWSPDGNFIYAGRRNNTVEEYDLRKGLKGPERVFKFPNGSGAVTSVKAMPNGRHLICASYDILRLYDLKEPQTTRSTVPFLIVPGHRTGVISHLYLDPACRFLMSTGGNRGWEGASTEVLLGYEISVPP